MSWTFPKVYSFKGARHRTEAVFAVCASHPPALGLILGVSKSFNSNLDVAEINRLHLEFGQVRYVDRTCTTKSLLLQEWLTLKGHLIPPTINS